MLKQIDICAKAFRSQGIRKGDVVTICMPNTPEGLIAFYAINRIGAIANMIHPLSSEQEIKYYLNSTHSVMLVMIDIIYEKVAGIIKETEVYKTIIVSAGSSLKIWKKFGYLATKSYKIKKPFFKGEYMFWRDFMARGTNYNGNSEFKTGKDDAAVFLHSGGTTGTPKAIVLANSNFTAMAMQIERLFVT
jgi:long-chain acyl-CoA synthetase